MLSNDYPLIPRDLSVHTAYVPLAKWGVAKFRTAQTLSTAEVARVGCSHSCGLDMDEPSEAELLRLAREGDPVALRILIRRHDRHLYRIARSVLLDDHEAEDVVQETYVRAFARPVDFRGDASLSTWLTRIALNEALQRHRRRRRVVSLDILDSASGQAEAQIRRSPMIAPDQDPERATAQHQIRILLERAIDDLPDTFRTVFIMRDIEEASTEETASVLGLHPETVKTRLHRARRRLRDALGEQIGITLKDAFPFERARCDRLVKRVLGQLGFSAKSLVRREP